MNAKNTICLWFDHDALEAARFYAGTFPDSRVTAVHPAPSDYPGGKQGEVLTVEFTVLGVPCLGLNGGPAFRHSEAFSFQITTETQEETDRYWNAITTRSLPTAQLNIPYNAQLQATGGEPPCSWHTNDRPAPDRPAGAPNVAVPVDTNAMVSAGFWLRSEDRRHFTRHSCNAPAASAPLPAEPRGCSPSHRRAQTPKPVRL